MQFNKISNFTNCMTMIKETKIKENITPTNLNININKYKQTKKEPQSISNFAKQQVSKSIDVLNLNSKI